ncbi:hypothetical protein WJX72_006233 [[Myrmecia] bisecta]|uniref:Tubulin delta chain n=1 Tax=[Myrmecia] bisecta TaxID=41462 RepID=A0AAW1QF88_9CHLO
MSVITVQLGQCGNQIGSSLFQCLAKEVDACSGDAAAEARDAFFAERSPSQGPGRAGSGRYKARAVLVDMEPKVINAAMKAAQHNASWWSYDAAASFSQQSGSGNNWARGYNFYGPKFAETACELVRRQVEAADHLGGFLLLQSMAGGTGAGLGTRIAEGLRDDFTSSFLLNHCIWPYESGEVIVQSYNTLLTLSHLTEVSDGVMLVENGALNLACQRLLNIQRPSFTDMNAVAAQALAAALLPARMRAATPPAMGGGRGRRLGMLGDVVEHLCCHPGYRLLSLRAVPQMAAAAIDFTTFTWTAILRRLQQMLITGSVTEEGMDWNVKISSPLERRARINKSLAALLTLRGQSAAEVDVASFSNPAMYPSWAVQPLSVAYSPARFAKCEMSASLLTNCQTCVGAVSRMQERAYKMLGAHAFLHQYAQFGLEAGHFEESFARVEDVVQRYRSL